MTDKLRFSAAVCCVLAMSQSGRVFAATAEFQLEDLKRIVSLSDARIAPDGKQIAVVVSTPDWKTDKARQEIDIFDAASGARRVADMETHRNILPEVVGGWHPVGIPSRGFRTNKRRERLGKFECHGPWRKRLAYPVDTHFPKDVVRTTDVYRRWVSWMNTHLK
jgi:hypothetical protein